MLEAASTDRAGVAFFYDKDGVVDEYYFHLLRSLRPWFSYLLVVANGTVRAQDESLLRTIADEVIVRENVDFDVGAYRCGLEAIGYQRLAKFRELILFNHTFFGPLFPWSEAFESMARRDCDMWGLSAHGDVPSVPPDGRRIPRHINSHFTAFRQPILSDPSFESYWRSVGPIESYEQSIFEHEVVIAEYFVRAGFRWAAYIDPADYAVPFPLFSEVDVTIERRCPIIKRRLFFHDPRYLEQTCTDLPRALDLIRTTSDYDMRLIWNNVARTTAPRVLATNASLTRIFDPEHSAEWSPIRLGVLVHCYHLDMFSEVLHQLRQLPQQFDLYVTTDSQEKRALIESALAGAAVPHLGRVDVRVCAVNRGRDIASLLIELRDVVLSGNYDLFCRLHTKKVPQADAPVARMFRRHMYENLVCSPGYASQILHMFEANEAIGIAFPSLFHISYPTHGSAWTVNRAATEDVLSKLEVRVPLDESTPVAPYGCMFWFRPQALDSLFRHEWAWNDFPKEPAGIDGTLAHAIERSFVYVAMQAGFIPMHLLNTKIAAFDYAVLEHKFQARASQSEFAAAFRIVKARLSHDLNSRWPTMYRIMTFAWKASTPVRRLAKRIVGLP